MPPMPPMPMPVAGAAGVGDAPGTAIQVTQTTDWVLAVPYWSWLYRPLIPRALRDGAGGADQAPWWAFGERLSARQATVVSALAVFHVVAGLFYALLGQLLTYIDSDLGSGSVSQQAGILAISRIGIVVTVVVMMLSDRVGRRRIAVWSFTAAGIAAVLTALSPNLWTLTVLQLLCRNLSIAGLLAVDVIALEELPARARAMAASLGALAYGLGSGLVVMTLPLADLGDNSWRLTFALSAVTIPLIISAARHLPESVRFTQLASDVPSVESRRIRGGRLVLMGAVLFLLNVLLAPSSQLQNDYLRTERGFSGTLITVFILLTSTPGGLGVLLGGRWSETRGRRFTAVPGLIGFGVFNALFFAFAGVPMWLGSLGAGLVGGLCVAPIGVLSGELFPTARRGGVQGWLTAISVAGSTIGLLAAGAMSDARGYGFAFVVLGTAPVIAAGLVLLMPETQGLELEEINRDRDP